MNSEYEKEQLKAALFHDLEASHAKHKVAADKFEAGLDKVIDVLLMLVLKFGRATTAQIISLVVLLACLVTVVITTINISYLRSEIRSLMYHQEELMQAQKRIEKNTTDTKKDTATMSQRVSEVADATPKIEVDQNGKAKLVLDEKKIDLKLPTEPKKKK